MSLFAGLSNEGLEQTEDRVGGGFKALETNIYTGKLKAAYAGASAGGARSVTLIFNHGGSSEYRETVYITNKAGQNWFHPKDKDGKRDTSKKVPLPGFTIIDDLCLIITGKPLSEQDAEEKVFNVYDADAKKELPKAVPMLIDLLDSEVSFAIQKSLENKSELVGNDYVATADERETNNIVKVFHTESRMTVVEAREGKTEPEFWDAWLSRNEGKTQDKRTIKDGAGGSAGAPKRAGAAGGAPAAGGGTERKSLFGNKK